MSFPLQSRLGGNLPYLILAVFFFSFSARADFSKNIYLLGESALFEKDDSRETKDQIASLILGLNMDARGENFSYRGKFAYRFDSFDTKRDLFFIDENLVNYEDSEGKHLFGIGHQRIQLGALEIFQSIDSINDIVMDSFVPEIQRRGVLSLSYRYTFDNHKVDFYYLPQFENPYFPANSSRLGYGFQFDNEIIISESGKEEKEGFRDDQFGFKFGSSLESIDLNFGHFRMIDRSLTFAGIDLDNQVNRYFFATDFTFFSFQKILGENLLKGNFYRKAYHGNEIETMDLLSGDPMSLQAEEHYMAALGFETKANIVDGHDTTLFFEAQKLLGLEEKIARRYSVFNNNFGWGFRHAFNDALGKQITFFNILNLTDVKEHIYQLDYRQMLNDSTKISLGLRVVNSKREEGSFSFDNIAGLTLLDDSDCLYLTLSKYF